MVALTTVPASVHGCPLASDVVAHAWNLPQGVPGVPGGALLAAQRRMAFCVGRSERGLWPPPRGPTRRGRLHAARLVAAAARQRRRHGRGPQHGRGPGRQGRPDGVHAHRAGRRVHVPCVVPLATCLAAAGPEEPPPVPGAQHKVSRQAAWTKDCLPVSSLAP